MSGTAEDGLPHDAAYAVLLAYAAWCSGRIHGAVAGLLAKIPAGHPVSAQHDAACLAVLRDPPPMLSEALAVTPEGQALLAQGWPDSPPEGSVQRAAGLAGELGEVQVRSLATLVLDGLRHWRTFDLLSGDIHAAMEDEASYVDARTSAPALFMHGEAAADEMLGLACAVSGQEPDEVRAQVDGIARAIIESTRTP
jgi:hypothetical protein